MFWYDFLYPFLQHPTSKMNNPALVFWRKCNKIKLHNKCTLLYNSVFQLEQWLSSPTQLAELIWKRNCRMAMPKTNIVMPVQMMSLHHTLLLFLLFHSKIFLYLEAFFPFLGIVKWWKKKKPFSLTSLKYNDSIWYLTINEW